MKELFFLGMNLVYAALFESLLWIAVRVEYWLRNTKDHNIVIVMILLFCFMMFLFLNLARGIE